MPRRRLSMRSIREVLRLKHELGRSSREIAESLAISHATASGYLRRAERAGVEWPLPEGFDDGKLEAALFSSSSSLERRPEPDWAFIHRELARHKGMTLQRLWLEYLEANPDGYRYSWFCKRYRAWRGRIDVVMRHAYRGGEKAFVDYAGPRVSSWTEASARSGARWSSWGRWRRRITPSWT